MTIYKNTRKFLKHLGEPNSNSNNQDWTQQFSNLFRPNIRTSVLRFISCNLWPWVGQFQFCAKLNMTQTLVRPT